MNSFSNFRSSTKPAILIIGPPGSGKSTIAAMIGTPHILEIDNNIDGPFTFLAKNQLPCKAFFSVPHVETQPDGTQTLVPRLQRWTKFTEAINKPLIDKTFHDTIVIDGLSGMVQYAMDEVRRQQNLKAGDPFIPQSKDDPFQQQHWGALLGLLRETFLKLRGSGKTLVVTGHVDNYKDEMDGILKQFIHVPGKFADEIAGLFTDVWFTEVENRLVQGKTTYVRTIRTVPLDARQTGLGLKSGLQLANKFDVDLNKITELVS